MTEPARHAEVFDADRAPAHGCLVVGVGAIGSRLALHLAELGVLAAVMDDDVVEWHNLANQAYGYAHLGQPKVDAIGTLCRDKGAVISLLNMRADGVKLCYGMVACCVDTMEARVDVFKGVENNHVTKLFIDTRMTATGVMVYALDPSDPAQAARYRESLYPSSDVDENTGGCSFAQTVGCTAQLAASLATARMIDWVMGKRRVFETLYDWQTGLYLEQLL